MFKPTISARLRDCTFLGRNAQIKTDNIAERELLTKDILIREIMRSKKVNIISKRLQRKICRHILIVMKSNKMSEQEVIYIFLRLWFFGEVKYFNFKGSFEKNKDYIQRLWLPRYGRFIEKNQKERIIV